MKDMSLDDVVTGYRNDGSRILDTDVVTDGKREMADAALCVAFGLAIADMQRRAKLPISELFDTYNKDRDGLLAAGKAIEKAEAAKTRRSFWQKFWPFARCDFNEKARQQDAKIQDVVEAVQEKVVRNIFARHDRLPLQAEAPRETNLTL